MSKYPNSNVCYLDFANRHLDQELSKFIRMNSALLELDEILDLLNCATLSDKAYKEAMLQHKQGRAQYRLYAMECIINQHPLVALEILNGKSVHEVSIDSCELEFKFQ